MPLWSLKHRPCLNFLFRFLITNNNLVIPMPTDDKLGRVVVIKHCPFNLKCVLIKPPFLFKVDVAGVSIFDVIQHDLAMMVYTDVPHDDIVY
jgi:hypothetical protein